MTHRPQLCENCGARLEVGYPWQKIVVCGSCYRELSTPKPARKFQTRLPPTRRVWPLVLAPLVLAVVIVGIVTGLKLRGTTPTAVASHDGSVAGDQPAEAPTTVPAFSLPPKRQYASFNFPQVVLATGPTTAPSTSSIVGVLSLARRGTSEPLANVRVQLLRPTVHREALQTSLAAEGRTWQELANLYDNQSQENTQDGSDTSDSQTSTDEQEIATESAAALLRVQTAIAALPQELDTLEAVRTLADLALFNVPLSTDAVTDATIGEVRTDDDGRFEFRNVPPGDYYLHAIRATRSAYLEWCTPVHTSEDGKAITIDLTSANAAIAPGAARP